ncbi:MAG: hypothetical protein ACKVRN_03970 [Pyrinomonadaceae bacterium]
MHQTADHFRNVRPDGGERTIIAGVVLMALAFIVTFFVIIAASGAFESYKYIFIVPWIIGLALVMAAPSAYLYYKGNFSFANPIVFATWSYFFPAFVLGGLFFAFGWSQPYFISFTQDVPYTLPLTIVLVALGFAGLSMGYFLPVGKRIGGFIERFLPQANYELSSYVGPGIVLLMLGIFNTILAFVLGILGYQKADAISSYDGLIYFTTLLWMEASFLLWNIIFRKQRFTVVNAVLIVLLISTALSKALLAGNRGSAAGVFIMIALAYVLSGRELETKQVVVSGFVLCALLMAGMIYGTTFRTVKGTESQQGFGQYAENVGRTFDQIGKGDSLDMLQFGLLSMTERIDVLTTFSVVVSNYEHLAPYEEAYDLDNNIWKDMTIFMVPRVIWKEKPPASDPRKYSDLYFNRNDTSFAITPMGDLLRNFGIVGIPIGMMVIGIFLRIFYRALIEMQPSSIWRSTLYFMLIMSISYETFYGTIIPSFFKVGFVAVAGLLIVNLLASIKFLPTR